MRRGVVLGALVAVLGWVAVSAGAEPTRSDRAATAAYVRARDRLFSALLAGVKSDGAPVTAYVQQVAAECPGVLGSAPHAVEVQDFFREEAAAFKAPLARWFLPPSVAFARAVTPLRWSSGKLTRAIRANANDDVKESRASAPDLCADYKAWATSGYRTLPPETERLATERPSTFGKEGDLGIQDLFNEGPWNKLLPYETNTLKRLGRQTQRLEEQFALAYVRLALGAGSNLRTLLGLSAVYRVPSGAMEPTLPIGTSVVLNEDPPAVGAIAVFHPPQDAEMEECGPKPHVVKLGGQACDAPVPVEDSGVRFIKRIVAGPGDEIYIREGHVYRKAAGASDFVRESDPYIRSCGTSPECNFPDPIKIPAGDWFMMGDNRGESDDSRFWGPVPTAWIVGMAGVLECRVFHEGMTLVRRTAEEGCAAHA
jgi:signal peptidase I